MTEGLVRQLEAELGALRAQLEKLDIFKDIQALERVIRRLRGATETPMIATTSEKPSTQGRQEAATSVAMKDAAERFLVARNGPALTKDIFDGLSAQGVHVPGDNPQNNLSAHLSRDSRFLSRGREGWVLASSVTPDLDVMKDVAEKFVAGLLNDRLLEIHAQVEATANVPTTTDGELLHFARSAIGRNLVEAEKRGLREHFKSYLDLRVLLS